MSGNSRVRLRRLFSGRLVSAETHEQDQWRDPLGNGITSQQASCVGEQRRIEIDHGGSRLIRRVDAEAEYNNHCEQCGKLSGAEQFRLKRRRTNSRRRGRSLSSQTDEKSQQSQWPEERQDI